MRGRWDNMGHGEMEWEEKEGQPPPSELSWHDFDYGHNKTNADYSIYC